MKYGMCDIEVSPASNYIDPEPAEYCAADTAPWHDLCPEHGGPDINAADPEEVDHAWAA
ncbi:hypothetical protein [Citricoccus sp. K5]|uniref:hypothetical protein n=1 Tax=Citricoccus sp. K5 TaxID=2653135 RepID=UPI0012F3113C|nr:hypothetical protein [Citricoccus sp. K5]VXA93445.1 hypothetical protein CITRIK5_100058 [Citricoccus sp. K5]VXA96328.1 hypothetical protein CITRIK5_100124 [Citricoccus sp. K5]